MVWAQLAISTHQITRYQVYVAFVWGSYNPYHLLPEPEWSYDQMDILIKFLHQKKQHFAPKNGGCQTILSFLGFKDLISKCVCVACCGGVSFAKKTNENFIHQPTDFTNANVLKIPEGFKTLGDFEVVTTICANISLKKSPNNQKNTKNDEHISTCLVLLVLCCFSPGLPLPVVVGIFRLKNHSFESLTVEKSDSFQ